MRKLFSFASLTLMLAVQIGPAMAEASNVSIVSTIGIAQLPGLVAYKEHFIEKRAASLGIPSLTLSYQEVSSGNVVSDLVLAGRANIAITGSVPLFYLWAKTKGLVKGMMVLSQGDMFLISCDPRVKTIADYTSQDRIAMTGLKTSTYAMILEMAEAKAFGWDNRNKLDETNVAMSDPDGMGAVLSCRTDVKSQMTILPTSTVELMSPKAHVVLSSEQVLERPYTFNVAFTTQTFRKNNPKVYQASFEGLRDAIDFIHAHPDKAADIYLASHSFLGSRSLLIKLISGTTEDHLSFTTVPNSTVAFMDYLYRSGEIKTKLKSWKNVWFDNLWNEPGS